LLEGLKLDLPALPTGTIRGKVAWAQGRDRALTGFVETGIQFMDLPAEYARSLNQYVAMRADLLFSDPDLMPPFPD
jgi:hypothetical protein